MAIASYNDLAAELKVWCARSDSVFSNRIETFVGLHEQRLYNGSGDKSTDPLFCEALSAPEMETVASVTVTSGIGDMPTDASTVRSIRRAGDLGGLEYMTPRQYAVRDAEPVGGDPQFFTVEASQIKVNGGYDGDITVFYYRRLPGISVDNQSNALLTAYPLLYLSGCLFEAFSFLQEIDLAMGHFTRFKAMVSGVNQSANSVRFGGTPLRIRTRQGMP